MNIVYIIIGFVLSFMIFILINIVNKDKIKEQDKNYDISQIKTDVNEEERRAGGLSRELPIDSKVIDIATSMKKSIEEILKVKLDKFEPISYSTQVVSGLIYYIKIKVGNKCFDDKSEIIDCSNINSSNIIIAKIYKDIGQHLSLLSLLTGKDAEDKIKYFL